MVERNRRLAATLAVFACAAGAVRSEASGWRDNFDKRYDAVVLGSGPKQSIFSSLLAANGKTVLQLEPRARPGGAAASLNLGELYERLGEAGDKPEEKLKLGEAAEYSVDLEPKFLTAGGKALQMLVSSGLWQQMDFRRVQRSFVYRAKPDGTYDVHRVLVSPEDVLKTRSLPAREKPKVFTIKRGPGTDSTAAHSGPTLAP